MRLARRVPAGNLRSFLRIMSLLSVLTQHLCVLNRVQVPMAEVQVNWTEIPGSKIRVTSMVHMAIELAMIKAGYASEWGVLLACGA